MYYSYRCYTQQSEPLGWLYTFDCGREYAWTNTDLEWCKRWKTQKGAEKHFDSYNRMWEFKSKGGYLKIEVMPEFNESKSSARSNQQRWNEANRDKVYQSQEKYNQKRPVLSFRPSVELLEWLEEERWTDDNDKPESDAALIHRKLTKLMKLEQQGF
jgi:hypothetical protein